MFDQPTREQSSGEQVVQELHCSSCGSPVPPQAQFCSHCGTPLPGGARAISPGVYPASLVDRPLASTGSSQYATEPVVQSKQAQEVAHLGTGAFHVSDITNVSLLRKRLGRVSFSMKVIGFTTAFFVWALAYALNPWWVGLASGILVFCVAFWLSNRMRSGQKYAAMVIALWTIVMLLFDLIFVPLLAQSIFSSRNFNVIMGSCIGLAILTLPIYFVFRGLLSLHAYKSNLRSDRSKFEPLAHDPWENGIHKTRKHPAFLNKTSIGLYVFLVLVPLIGTIFLILVFISLEEALIGRPLFFIPRLVLGLVIALLGGMLMALLYRRARRHAMLSASELVRKDKRAIVLYLRPFCDDKIKLWAQANDGRIFLERLVRISFEELLTDHLWRFGPVVAIGDPHTKRELAPLGAARDFESDATWHQKVIDLMQQASLIVAVAGKTGGFMWEIERIMQLGFTSKLVLILPPVDTIYLTERWNTLVNTVISVKLPQDVDLKRTRAVVFPAGQVVLITAQERNDWTYETVLDDAAAFLLDQSKLIER